MGQPVKEKYALSLKGSVGAETMTLDELNRTYIQEVLAATNGKVNGRDGAAALLGVHPNTLRNRIKKLGVAFGRQHRRL